MAAEKQALSVTGSEIAREQAPQARHGRDAHVSGEEVRKPYFQGVAFREEDAFHAPYSDHGSLVEPQVGPGVRMTRRAGDPYRRSDAWIPPRRYREIGPHGCEDLGGDAGNPAKIAQTLEGTVPFSMGDDLPRHLRRKPGQYLQVLGAGPVDVDDLSVQVPQNGQVRFRGFRIQGYLRMRRETGK